MKLETEIPDDWQHRLDALQIPAEHRKLSINERMVFFMATNWTVGSYGA